MSKPIREIVIVGGGTAGWITAGTIAAKHRAGRECGISITLVESPNIPIVGVGEGTWPTMRHTLSTMGISETDFIRDCDASFKQGAKFARWVSGTPDDWYYHPLVLPHGFLQGNLAPHWLAGEGSGSFAEAVCAQQVLCERNRAPKQITTPEYAGVVNYAYHLNAGTFSEFIKRHCVAKLGVRHIRDDVTKVNSADDGDICSVSTREHGDLRGDLFIDCTGFRSLLLGEHLGVKFRSRKGTLFVDCALALQVPHECDTAPITSHTVSTAQEAGWIWDIALSTRRGVGYVYSSAHTSDETAERRLREYLGPTAKATGSLPVRKLAIDPGHRERFWERNCVAVGLSAGFLEPLEASAIVLVELSANMIAEQLPVTREAMEIVGKRFNDKFLYRWDRIVDFLKLHYLLSKRSDNDFWIDNRAAASVPESLRELVTLWKYQCPWHDEFVQKDEVFPAASYQYVLYGMGFRTEPSHLGTSEVERAFAAGQFRENRLMTEKLVSLLPSNREILQKIQQYGMQKV